MIANMPHFAPQEVLSQDRQYDIMQENLRIYKFHKAQEAFAHFYLFYLAGTLGKPQLPHILEAIKCFNENMTYHIVYLWALMHQANIMEVENALRHIYKQYKEEFLKEFLVWQQWHGYIYSRILNEFLALKSTQETPYINYVKGYIQLNLMEMELP